MGIYDRDYARDREPGFHVNTPQTMVGRLIVATCIVYAVQLIWRPTFTIWFALDDDWFRAPWKAYQLLSYGFLHDINFEQGFAAFHILLNMYVFWMFGPEIESRQGSREFLLYYLASMVFAGLAWTASELPFPPGPGMLGASGAVSAVVVLFALYYPHRQILLFFVLPLPMWVAAILFVGLDIHGAIVRSGNVAFTAHLGGALFALLYYKLNWRLSNWLPSNLSLPKLNRGPKLRVHQPDDDDEEDMEAKVDAILDKISRQGRESLTRAEKNLLEQASREYQQRRK